MISFLSQKLAQASAYLQTFAPTPVAAAQTPPSFLEQFKRIHSTAKHNAISERVPKELRDLFNNTPNLDAELTANAEQILKTILDNRSQNWPQLQTPYYIYLLNYPIIRNSITPKMLETILDNVHLDLSNQALVDVIMQIPTLIPALTDEDAIYTYSMFRSVKLFGRLLENIDFANQIQTMTYDEIASLITSDSLIIDENVLKQLISIPTVRSTLIQGCTEKPNSIISLVTRPTHQWSNQALRQDRLFLLEIPELQNVVMSNRGALLKAGITAPSVLPALLQLDIIKENIPAELKQTILKSAIYSCTKSSTYTPTNVDALFTLLNIPEWKAHAIDHKRDLMREALNYPAALKVLLKIKEFKDCVADKENALFIKAVKISTDQNNTFWNDSLASAEMLFKIPTVRAAANARDNEAYHLLTSAQANSRRVVRGGVQVQSPFENLRTSLLAIPAVQQFANGFNAARLLQNMKGTPEEIEQFTKVVQPLLLSGGVNGHHASTSMHSNVNSMEQDSPSSSSSLSNSLRH